MHPISRGRILFADDDPEFLKTRAEFLQKQGFDVTTVTTIEDTEQLLQDEWFHLTIFDIRMLDENDERDTSGLNLAKKEAYQTLPKIMLTGYPSYNYVREALSPALDGLPPAVEFLSKQDGPDAMIQAVEEAFEKYIRSSRDLAIRWGKSLSFLHVVNLIEEGIDNKGLINRTAELEDLFRRLFYRSHQITISRCLTQSPQSVVLAVFDFSDSGNENQFIVICGHRSYVQLQEAYYQRHISQNHRSGGLIKIATVENIHYAATAFALSNGDLEEIITLAEFYQHHSTEDVQSTFDGLLHSTLGSWHEKGRYLEDKKTLHELLFQTASPDEESFSPSALESQIQALCRECIRVGLNRFDYTRAHITFYPTKGDPVIWPNPVSFLTDKINLGDKSVLCSNIHGQLQGTNILVDQEGRTWLTNFSTQQRGPLVYDFASLETMVKFELLSPIDIDLRYKLENLLLSTNPLDEPIQSEDLEPELLKALQIIFGIRHQAAAVLDNDLEGYLEALLFSTIKNLVTYMPAVSHTRPELVPYAYSLLAAAMLYEKLAPHSKLILPVEAQQDLWVDEDNRSVWVEGQEITLSPQEYDLISYLYQHSGQLCTRTALAEEVFGVKFDPGLLEVEKRRMEQDRINSAMSRLRKKLEPDPKNPRYIKIVRGQGYRLEVARKQ